MNNSEFDGNISVHVVDNLLSTQYRDETLDSSHFYFQDDDFFLVKVTQAILEDFQTKCLEFECVNETDLVALLHEICSDGISALYKVSIRPDKTTALSSVLQQLMYEKQAYSLILKLAEMDGMLNELKDFQNQTVLADLLIRDPEFRKLLVLLEWCEENANDDPEAIAQLASEYVYFEKHGMLKADTLHARIVGEKFCDLDLDGAFHGHQHHKDAEFENRIFSVVYTLLRCGRIDEAYTLLEKSGLHALAPTILLRKFFRDFKLTPVSSDETLHYLSRSRFFFKRTVDKVVSRDARLSQVEICLWSVLAGRLEPALSLSSRSEDRLWCYLNVAVESRLDAAIAAADITDGDCDAKSDDLQVNSVFDEIAVHEQSLYYTVYRHIVNDDSSSLLASMDTWLESHINELERFPHIVRFMAHIVLLLRFTNQEIQEEIANSIIEAYVRLLITLKMYPVVPYYASKLPAEISEEIVIEFMYKLESDVVRKEVLAAACAAQMDKSSLCVRIFDYALSRCPVGEDESENDDILINAWTWLTYSENEMLVEALQGVVEIMRKFFYVDKLDKADELFHLSKKIIDKTLISLSSSIEENNSIDSELSAAVIEYKAYACYLLALTKFNEWFKHSQRFIQPFPSNLPVDASVSMDMQQRLTLEVIHQRVSEQVLRYENEFKQITAAVVNALGCVLRFPHGWLKFTTAHSEIFSENVLAKLCDIRSRYVTAVVIMLLTVFERSNMSGCAQLIELLADEEYMIGETIPKRRLRLLLKQLSVQAYKNM
ncbi:unnamed protein product [Thelazia callipaeda]|uniref:Nuclear pore complex protein n=1 Tax=Thelazia callipaeda TaxID=103827 RepID=A0A0N5CZ72_THECL|nr:unnamed protein product [Thelazia callipaeda]